MRYPSTRRGNVVEEHFGQHVADPFRWLEDSRSSEVSDWIRAQNEVTASFVSRLASRDWFAESLGQLFGREVSLPLPAGDGYIVSRYANAAEQPHWRYCQSLAEIPDAGRVVLDPNLMFDDPTTAIMGVAPNGTGQFLAYTITEGGSDWFTIRVRSISTGEDTSDLLTHARHSDIWWLPDNRSFLYLHFPDGGSPIGTETSWRGRCRLMRHVLGDLQEGDELVWETLLDPLLLVDPAVSHDGKWLILHIANGTATTNALAAMPLDTRDGQTTIGPARSLIEDHSAKARFVRVVDNEMVMHTTSSAPLGRVISVNLELPRAEPREIIPQSSHTLHQAVAVGDEYLAVYLEDGTPTLKRFSLEGHQLGTIDVPGLAVNTSHGSNASIGGGVGERKVFLGLTSVTQPVTPHLLDLSDGRLSALVPAPVGSVPSRIERLDAKSADGTSVGYWVIRSADGGRGAETPTLLYAYGGFGVAVPPEFDPLFASWLEAGGVVAIASLRGGGEFGEAWYDAGRLKNKVNVFDDFVAVCDDLVERGVTSRTGLVIHGASNGGLTIGASILRRPDLAGAAIAAIGVQDMLRYHLFTCGVGWLTDYGSPEDPELFSILRSYSPVHNASELREFPPTLIVTGDHDDRVPQAHSLKFAAALQTGTGGPALLRVEHRTGHWMGRPRSKFVAEGADVLAFAAEFSGLLPKTPAPPSVHSQPARVAGVAEGEAS